MIKFIVDLGGGEVELYINSSHITSVKITNTSMVITTMYDEFTIPNSSNGYEEAINIFEALKLVMRSISPIAQIGNFGGIQ